MTPTIYIHLLPHNYTGNGCKEKKKNCASLNSERVENGILIVSVLEKVI